MADPAPGAAAQRTKHNLILTVGGCRAEGARATCSCGWERDGATKMDAQLLFGRHLVTSDIADRLLRQ